MWASLKVASERYQVSRQYIQKLYKKGKVEYRQPDGKGTPIEVLIENLDNFFSFSIGQQKRIPIIVHKISITRSEYFKKRYSEKKEIIKEAAINYKKNNRLKVKAHNRIGYLVKKGLLSRPDNCEICSSTSNIEGHHFDYSKPEVVLWVCKSCHMKIHNGMGNVAKNK